MKIFSELEDIKKEICKYFDVSKWTFFINETRDLEFYESNPEYSYIYCRRYLDIEDIEEIAGRLIAINGTEWIGDRPKDELS